MFLYRGDSGCFSLGILFPGIRDVINCGISNPEIRDIFFYLDFSSEFSQHARDSEFLVFWDFLSRNDFDLQGDLSIVFLKSHLFLVRGLTEAVFLERQRSYLINLGISNRS